MTITSKNNIIIKEILKNVKDYVLLDTIKLINEALENDVYIEKIFIEEGKQFPQLPNKIKSEIFFVSRNIIELFSNVKTNIGIIAIAKYKPKPFSKLDTNFLVLDNVQDPGNVGTLLRSALGANFKTVFLIDCAKITNDKTFRSSVGSIFKLNLFELSKNEFIELHKKNKFRLLCADMNGENIFETKITKQIGLVLGNEGQGVSEEIRNLCERSISIPMQNKLESLNVSVSGSIIMYFITNGGKCECQVIANGII